MANREPDQPQSPSARTTEPTGLSPAEAKERSAGFCALAHTDRRRAEESFALLALQDQARIVLAAEPADRVDLLLLADDPTPIVRALPGPELLRAVQSVGKWEAQEIVEVASEDQINFMLDHDCWRGEFLDSRKFMDWLTLFMDCSDEQVFRLLTAINADLLALALKKHLRFKHDIMVQDTYYCDPDWVSGSNATVEEFMHRLYALDPGLWIRIVGWVRTHSRGTIEADAVEAREARLRGHGFPAPSLAITVYYPVDYNIQPLVAGWRQEFLVGHPDGAAALVATPERQPLFLERVTEAAFPGPAGDDLFRARLEAELVNVANKVMIADVVDVGDIRKERECVDKVRRWINLGLEAIAMGAVDQGRAWLRKESPEFFFRIGAMFFDALGTAVVDLQKAEHKARSGLATGDSAGLFLALVEPEPRIPVGPRQGGARPIATLADYRYAWMLVWYLTEALHPAPAGGGPDRQSPADG